MPELVDPDRDARLRIVWKSIESVGRFGIFARYLEACPAILIVRHPCGQVGSVLRGESQRRFGDNRPSSDDYGIFEALLRTEQAKAHGLTLAMLQALEPIERLAWRWVLYNEKALGDSDGLENCMTLRYEDLCAEPVTVAKQLFAFANMTWDAQTERYIADSMSSTKDTGYYGLAKDPLRTANK